VRSVIHWPEVHMRSGSRLISRGPAWSMSAWLPQSSRVRAAPSVMASGHDHTSSEGCQVVLGELVDPGVGAEGRVIVARGHQAVLGRQALGPLPQRRQLDVVDAVAPRVPLREHRLVRQIGQLLLVQLAASQLAQGAQLVADPGPRSSGEVAVEVVPQQGIVVVLVAEDGRALQERHALDLTQAGGRPHPPGRRSRGRSEVGAGPGPAR
jgi:hypothetical protein